MQLPGPQQGPDLRGKIARQSGVSGALRAFGRLSCKREDLSRARQIRCQRNARIPDRVSAARRREPIEWRFARTRRAVAESVAAPVGGVDLEPEIQLRLKKRRPGIRERASEQDEVPGAEVARLHQAAVARDQDSSLA